MDSELKLLKSKVGAYVEKIMSGYQDSRLIVYFKIQHMPEWNSLYFVQFKAIDKINKKIYILLPDFLYTSLVFEDAQDFEKNIHKHDKTIRDNLDYLLKLIEEKEAKKQI